MNMVPSSTFQLEFFHVRGEDRRAPDFVLVFCVDCGLACSFAVAGN